MLSDNPESIASVKNSEARVSESTTKDDTFSEASSSTSELAKVNKTSKLVVDEGNLGDVNVLSDEIWDMVFQYLVWKLRVPRRALFSY
jgi:hypothetical protein